MQSAEQKPCKNAMDTSFNFTINQQRICHLIKPMLEHYLPCTGGISSSCSDISLSNDRSDNVSLQTDESELSP